MTGAAPTEISERLIREVVDRIHRGAIVRRKLPQGGRLYVDRQVPFLCVYRRPSRRPDAGTDRLITGTAAYLIGCRSGSLRDGQAALLRAVAKVMQEEFGAFLLIEVWSGRDQAQEPALPTARVTISKALRGEAFVDVFRRSLARDRHMAKRWRVITASSRPRTAPPPLLTTAEARALDCTRLGLEVPPMFRAQEDQVLFPVVLRNARRAVDVAVRKAVHEFTRKRTGRRPSTYQALGRRAMVKVVWRVDDQLARLSRAFDFLLALTPVNLEASWQSFRRHNFERRPRLLYRPLTVDVSQAKRQLFSIPMERIEDPTMADLFLEKQLELDQQLSILAMRGSRRVLYGSLQLYGGVSEALLGEARAIIERIPPSAREPGDARPLPARELARLAEAEISLYREQMPEEDLGVELRDDIASGLMVSRGRLLVASRWTFPRSRVEALLQHEVGTHLLTYLNGRAQKLQQLSVGLADYDRTQEGLAVLAEYLSGGMSRPRMRWLAGRVFAVRAMVDGATFIETFRLLLRYGFAQQTAFSIVARVFRGGGLTKDAVYLGGVMEVLDYLRAGEPLEDLFVGKISLQHVGIVRELRARGILTPPPLHPRYLQAPGFQRRMARLRRGGLRAYQLTEEER